MSSYPSITGADISGKRVFVRAGFDLPMQNGVITDTSRVEAVIPTIKYILDKGGAVILASHQDRPKGKVVPEFSQKPIVPILEKLLRTKVLFADSCTGEATAAMCRELKMGSVLLLENLRFDKREEENDAAFAQELASLADVYVNEAFTNCHRKHASMVGIAQLIPSYMGLQLEQEVANLSRAVHQPRRPLTLIISGAKIETKLPVIRHFMATGDDVLIGGAIANTFIAAEGYDVGTSLQEKEFHATAKDLLKESAVPDAADIHVPTDVVVAQSPKSVAVTQMVTEIPADSAIYDVGPETIKGYETIIAQSGCIVWNGPLGMYETEAFAGASKKIADAVMKASKNGAITIIGGGDTIDFHIRYGLDMSPYTFVSTGGGAMLEFVSGKLLPALEALGKNA